MCPNSFQSMYIYPHPLPLTAYLTLCLRFSHAYTLNVTKTSNTAKASILDLLGTIMLHHPTKVSEPQVAQTFRWCLGTLQHQLFSSKEAENNLVTGALRGLNKMIDSSHNTIERGKLIPSPVDSIAHGPIHRIRRCTAIVQMYTPPV